MRELLAVEQPSFVEQATLSSLLDKVLDIQSSLKQLANAAADAAMSSSEPGALEIRIRRILKLRSSRRRIFGDDLFGEPAWDMLLELYLAKLAGKNEAVSSICLASGVPFTTALRWLKHLEKDDWVRRSADTKDARRILLFLTPRGEAAMEEFFAQAAFAKGV